MKHKKAHLVGDLLAILVVIVIIFLIGRIFGIW